MITTYSYGDATWKDILTDVNGTAYTSDAIGNLTNDGEWTYTWQHGRQLAGMSKAGNGYRLYLRCRGTAPVQERNGRRHYN